MCELFTVSDSIVSPSMALSFHSNHTEITILILFHRILDSVMIRSIVLNYIVQQFSNKILHFTQNRTLFHTKFSISYQSTFPGK